MKDSPKVNESVTVQIVNPEEKVKKTDGRNKSNSEERIERESKA